MRKAMMQQKLDAGHLVLLNAAMRNNLPFVPQEPIVTDVKESSDSRTTIIDAFPVNAQTTTPVNPGTPVQGTLSKWVKPVAAAVTGLGIGLGGMAIANRGTSPPIQKGREKGDILKYVEQEGRHVKPFN